MIRFKLKEVLAQKNMTMARLSSQTGISKNTLSLLGKGASQGIQFDTLNKILNETNANVSDLIEYYPDKLLDTFKITIQTIKEEYDLDSPPEDETLQLTINAYLFQTLKLIVTAEDTEITIQFKSIIHYFQPVSNDTIYCVIDSQIEQQLNKNLLLNDVFLKNYLVTSVNTEIRNNIPSKLTDYIASKNEQQLPIKYSQK
ncbi:hypothetical protein CI088_11705 [Enterococcus plantarum]|uniref:HTH cro/C1-type domain-containing protein n=1 Tax=Enterococcus plantarum TaxID=1077675 RepID=A0A2W3YVW8_9ENTE|nr:helix-turn-helix transcriptional regulator [Enterococcus plantarum]PZL71741.1 hypothetical protein CI088_11705 [Enterococcus plantarum]